MLQRTAADGWGMAGGQYTKALLLPMSIYGGGAKQILHADTHNVNPAHMHARCSATHLKLPCTTSAYVAGRGSHSDTLAPAMVTTTSPAGSC